MVYFIIALVVLFVLILTIKSKTNAVAKSTLIYKDFDSQNKGTKILWTDDDHYLLDIYSKKFTAAGYNVATMLDANDGDEKFVDKVSRLNPDLFITDILKPGRDGFEAIRILRNDPRTKSLPIIIVSNAGNKSDMDEANKLGVLAYIVKASTTISQVVDEVRKLMPNSKVLSTPTNA